MNPFGILNFGGFFQPPPLPPAQSGLPRGLRDEPNARGAAAPMPAPTYATGGELGDPAMMPGLLNQRSMPQLAPGPGKMDPGVMPLGLLNQPDEPAPMAANAGPMPSPAQPPMQLPSAGGGAPAPQAQGGLLAGVDGFLNRLGNMYGAGGPGDGLVNLGIAVGSPGNMARNINQANEATNRSRLVNAQLERQQQTQAAGNETDKLLSQRLGISVEQARAVRMSGAADNILSNLFKPATATNPQLVTRERPGGGTEQVWLRPGETTGPVVSASEPSGPIDDDTVRKERAKALVRSEEDATQKRRIYDTVDPLLTRAENAYKTLQRLNAIGPIDASGTNRFIGGVFGTQAEKARQDFEAAAKELELLKAQISMKGQGQITESERKILQLTLPRLDAADAETGLTTMVDMRKRFRKEAGLSDPSPSQPGAPASGRRLRYNPQTGALE